MDIKDKNKIIHKANIERAFVATVMQSLIYFIDNMINYCVSNGIKIDSFEKRQLNVIKEATKHITIDYISLEKSKSDEFKSYSKVMAVTIQELFSRTENNSMLMYKFYNYIKAFPIQNHNIDVPVEIEQEAFNFIFNKENNEHN